MTFYGAYSIITNVTRGAQLAAADALSKGRAREIALARAKHLSRVCVCVMCTYAILS